MWAMGEQLWKRRLGHRGLRGLRQMQWPNEQQRPWQRAGLGPTALAAPTAPRVGAARCLLAAHWCLLAEAVEALGT